MKWLESAFSEESDKKAVPDKEHRYIGQEFAGTRLRTFSFSYSVRTKRVTIVDDEALETSAVPPEKEFKTIFSFPARSIGRVEASADGTIVLHSRKGAPSILCRSGSTVNGDLWQWIPEDVIRSRSVVLYAFQHSSLRGRAVEELRLLGKLARR